MLPAEPKIANSRSWILREWWRCVGTLLVGNGKQAIDLAGIEAGEAEVEIRGTEFLQLEAQEPLPIGQVTERLTTGSSFLLRN